MQDQVVPRAVERVGHDAGLTVAKVACGNDFTACLTDAGGVLTFGFGAAGQVRGDEKIAMYNIYMCVSFVEIVLASQLSNMCAVTTVSLSISLSISDVFSFFSPALFSSATATRKTWTVPEPSPTLNPSGKSVRHTHRLFMLK